jgi:hypothetical protein
LTAKSIGELQRSGEKISGFGARRARSRPFTTAGRATRRLYPGPRNTLAIGLAVAFTAGGGPTVVLPWLPAAISTDVSTLALWCATLIGLGIGTIVPLQRFGLPRWS